MSSASQLVTFLALENIRFRAIIKGRSSTYLILHMGKATPWEDKTEPRSHSIKQQGREQVFGVSIKSQQIPYLHSNHPGSYLKTATTRRSKQMPWWAWHVLKQRRSGVGLENLCFRIPPTRVAIHLRSRHDHSGMLSEQNSKQVLTSNLRKNWIM